MTAVRTVDRNEMHRRTGFKSALGYAFPERDEILVLEGLPAAKRREVLEHEEQHITRGEEGPFLDSLIDIGGSLLGGLIGSKGAEKAGDASAKAAQINADYQREARDTSIALGNPFRQGGYQAYAAAMDMVGLDRGTPAKPGAGGGAGAMPNLPNFPGFPGAAINQAMGGKRAPTKGSQDELMDRYDVPDLASFKKYDWKQDPGYQFRMDEGMKALERSASARGGLVSGGFGNRAIMFAQNYASNEYQNVYARLLNLIQPGSAALDRANSSINSSAYMMGQGAIQAGESRGSAYIGQANAWANTINGLGKVDWGQVFG